MDWTKSLVATCTGRVRFTSEVFDPNFDHPIASANYGHRQGQQIWKKYAHVIPSDEHNRFKLVDVV